MSLEKGFMIGAPKLFRAKTDSASIENTLTIPTVIDFQTPYIDELGVWDSGSPDEIIVPIGYTRCKIAWHVEFTSNATGSRACRMTINGGSPLFHPTYVNLTDTTNAIPSITTHLGAASLEIGCVEGDILRIAAGQNSGAALALIGGGGWMEIEWLG